MQQVHPDAKFRDSATEMTRKASAAATALSLNRGVYQALGALDLSKADPATRHFVSRQLLQFRLAGVDKDDATRARLKQLNDQLTEQQSAFDRNISDGQKVVKVAGRAALEGLPQDYIDRHKPAADGTIQITTDYPDVLPAMKFVKSDALRRQLFEALNTRAYPKNGDVLRQMMQTRYEIATLLGYASWADYFAADKMAGRGQRIADFIQEVDQAARTLADREFAMLLAEKKKTDPTATAVGDYEVGHLQELLRRSKYDFDSQSVRPYPALCTGEAGDPRHGGKPVRFDLPPGSGRAGVGPECRDVGRDRWRQSHRTLLSRHASAAGQIQPCGDGAGGGWRARQTTARGGAGLQFSQAGRG